MFSQHFSSVTYLVPILVLGSASAGKVDLGKHTLLRLINDSLKSADLSGSRQQGGHAPANSPLKITHALPRGDPIFVFSSQRILAPSGDHLGAKGDGSQQQPVCAATVL